MRFLVAFIDGEGAGHVQSLILGAVLFIAAVLLGALGVIGDLLAAQRTLSQRTFERVRRIELALGIAPSHYEPGTDAGAPRRRGARAGDDRGMSDATAEAVPTGNTFDKYGSTNPVVRRLMAGFERDARRAVRAGRAAVGARRRLRRGRADARVGAARSATADRRHRPRRPEAARRVGDAPARRTSSTARCAAENLPFADDEFDLACAIEVLEHVPDPAHTVAEMARVAQRHLLVSVPREPLWRVLNMARGAYLRDLGNTPGHVNHWSKRSFVRLLSQHGEVVEKRSPFPWTMLLVRLGS